MLCTIFMFKKLDISIFIILFCMESKCKFSLFMVREIFIKIRKTYAIYSLKDIMCLIKFILNTYVVYNFFFLT